MSCEKKHIYATFCTCIKSQKIVKLRKYNIYDISKKYSKFSVSFPVFLELSTVSKQTCSGVVMAFVHSLVTRQLLEQKQVLQLPFVFGRGMIESSRKTPESEP